ncbi:MAG: hypothetical protein M5U01_20730 [Ardenticatenaceae bacterium]|nr:hypothetical protein [Ardenticatenaceae bacterium]
MVGYRVHFILVYDQEEEDLELIAYLCGVEDRCHFDNARVNQTINAPSHSTLGGIHLAGYLQVGLPTVCL